MSDAVKHTTGTVFAVGAYGITLAQMDHVISIICGIAGTIAAACTIHSWWRQRKKNQQHKK